MGKVGRPLLVRPFKDSIIDTMKILPGAEMNERLFQDPRMFPDGTPKRSGIDTNMTQGGQLGYPRFFDLVHWTLAFEEFRCPADVRAVLRNLKLTLHFGQCDIRNRVHVYEAVGSAFTPILIISDGLTTDWLSPGKPISAEISDYNKVIERIESALRAMAEEGKWTHYYCGIVKDKAIRIESTIRFCVHAHLEPTQLQGPVRLKVMLRGVDYRPDPGAPERAQKAD